MARMIDADRLLRELTALSHGQVWPGWTYDGIRLLIERQPTLTPPVDPDDNGGVFNVLPSTVGQYSGLDDSDGRKVFEGDILKFRDEPNDYEWTGRIEFGNPNYGYTWGFQIVHLSGPKPNIDTLCWFDMEEGGAYSEVIGTVFDEVNHE